MGIRTEMVQQRVLKLVKTESETSTRAMTVRRGHGPTSHRTLSKSTNQKEEGNGVIVL